MTMTCTCYNRGRLGFRYVRGWFVCGFCGLPTEPYLKAMIRTNGGQRREDEEDTVGLIHFRGGPLGGYTYESGDLLGHEALALPVTEYNWTSEKIKSETSGRVAQVWVHKDAAGEAATTPSPTPAPKKTSPAAPAKKPEPVESSVASAPVPPPADDTSSSSAAAETPAAPAAMNGAASSTDNLEERRKKLKLSRKEVSDATGLAQSKVWGIETGKAKRVKEDERQQLAAYIASKESETAGV